MNQTKQWKDIVNTKKNSNQPKNNFELIKDIIKSNDNGIYFKEKIPQIVIKKSLKDANKK